MTKYPRGSDIRLWGIRLCHSLGFVGVIVMWLAGEQASDLSLLIAFSLGVSAVGFEISIKYLD